MSSFPIIMLALFHLGPNVRDGWRLTPRISTKEIKITKFGNLLLIRLKMIFSSFGVCLSCLRAILISGWSSAI